MIFICKACKKKYKRMGKWFFKHFDEKHSGEYIKVKEIARPRFNYIDSSADDNLNQSFSG